MFRDRLSPNPSRRKLLASGVVGLLTGKSLAVPPAEPKVEAAVGDRARIAAIRAEAAKKSLGPFRQNLGEHFLAIGDASDDYQNEVLGFCEKLAKTFLSYFKERGFTVALPAERMAVVVLKNRKSYGVWNGEQAENAIGGHYDLDTNRLVVFDFRNDPGPLGNQAPRVNSFTLAHETNHLLGFNSGLLARGRDIPDCISEGLATCGELWQLKGRSNFGIVNRPRLDYLAEAARRNESWIDIEKLLTDDQLCRAAETRQLAYAESWLFVAMLLKKHDRIPKLRAYLDRMNKASKPEDRVRCAQATLGPLASLDRELRNYGEQLLSR